MDYLNFVTENYIWFLVGGIVLLMTLIGYYAEKTKFGKKNKKEKVEEKTAPVKSVVIPTAQEQLEEILFERDMPAQDVEVETVEETEEPMEDLDEIEIQEPEETTESEEIPEELYAGLDGTPNTYKEIEETEDLEMDLPDIEDLRTNIDDTSSDDDMWRF